MILKVNYFGMIAERMDTQHQELDLELSTVGELAEHFSSRLSGLSFKVAVNKALVEDNHPLKEGDEIALLPPFAGG